MKKRNQDLINLGLAIRRARIVQELSRKDVSDMARIPQHTIRRIEDGLYVLTFTESINLLKAVGLFIEYGMNKSSLNELEILKARRVYKKRINEKLSVN